MADAILCIAPDRDDRGPSYLVFNEDNIHLLDVNLLSFEMALGTGAGKGGRKVVLRMAHPARPAADVKFRVSFECRTPTRVRSDDTSSTAKQISKLSFLVQYPEAFVTKLREIHAKLMEALTSREPAKVLMKREAKGAKDRAQWEVKEMDISTAEWALAGGINLYKDAWDDMGLPRKGKMTDLSAEQYAEFRTRLIERAGTTPRKPDGNEPMDQRPWVRPLVYGQRETEGEGERLPPAVAVALKNFKDGAAVKSDNGEMPQTRIFMWVEEDGVRVKKALSVPEALPHITHGGEGAPAQAHYIKTVSRFSVKHWWIDPKGVNGLVHLDTLEFEPAEEQTTGYFSTDIGDTFGGAKAAATEAAPEAAPKAAPIEEATKKHAADDTDEQPSAKVAKTAVAEDDEDDEEED